jgi:hypothetical protein
MNRKPKCLVVFLFLAEELFTIRIGAATQSYKYVPGISAPVFRTPPHPLALLTRPFVLATDFLKAKNGLFSRVENGHFSPFVPSARLELACP